MTATASPAVASPDITTQRPGWAAEKLPLDTVPQMFWLQVDMLGDALMMRQKDLGLWRGYS